MKFLTNYLDDSHPCAQPKFVLAEGKIGCFAIIPAWYHDHSTGECKEYTYDGCSKNANHFATKADCDKTCAEWHEAHKDHHHGSSHKHSDDCNHEHDHEHHHHH